MKPAFSTLWANYPRSDQVPRPRLFDSIGWSDLTNNAGYQNTCAIRVSIALQKSGVPVTSSAGMKGLSGAMTNKAIEIRQAKLSEQLTRLWGAPELISSESEIGDRNGVISFFEIPTYPLPGGGFGGHIDLIDGKSTWFFGWFNADSVCGSSCYWSAKRVGFWELR